LLFALIIQEGIIKIPTGNGNNNGNCPGGICVNNNNGNINGNYNQGFPNGGNGNNNGNCGGGESSCKKFK